MADYIRVRVTEKAAGRIVCYERSAMHPGGEARVKGVGTTHTVGQTAAITAGLRNGTLELVPGKAPAKGKTEDAAEAPAADDGPAEGDAAAGHAEDPVASLPIPATLWQSASIPEVLGARVLGDLPDATLAAVARALPKNAAERAFISAAKGRVTKSRAGRAKTRYTKPAKIN